MTDHTPLERVLELVKDIGGTLEGARDNRYVTVPVGAGESVDVHVGEEGDDWDLYVTYVTWSNGSRETPPDPSEKELAGVDDPGLADAVIRTAIARRTQEEAAIAEAWAVAQAPVLGLTVTLDRSKIDDGAWWAEAATEQWTDAAEKAGLAVEVVSYDVPDVNHDAAIIAESGYLYVISVRDPDGEIRARPAN